MKFYVIRHGQTDWNVESRLQGATDVPLNETGIRQAEEARAALADYPVDLIVCSTLQRARKTAEILNEAWHCPILYTEALIERGYGELEGKTTEELKQDPVKASGVLSSYVENVRHRGVEPVQTLCGRIGRLLDELRAQHPGKNILLVSHGAAIRAITWYFTGLREDGTLPSPRLGNCGIREFEC